MNLGSWGKFFVFFAVFLGVMGGFNDALALDPLTEADCRCCHGDTLADRHHLLVPTSNLECLDCHEMVLNSATSLFEPRVVRDCKVCHTGSLADRHHLLVNTGTFDCFSCHSVEVDPVTNTFVPTLDRPCVETPPVTTGSITGSVSASDGSGLGGARVAAADGSFSTTTTSQGAFQIDGVPAGALELVASKTGFSTVSRSLNVVAGQVSSIGFVLTALPTTGTISGSVLDQGGNPISGASVSTDAGGHSTLSAADGTYLLSAIPAGPYVVTAAKSGFSSSALPVSLSGGQATILDLVLTALGPEICTDQADNDGDGQIDCADSDCAGSAACATSEPEICFNGIDDDNDGLTDCLDSDCNGDPACIPEPQPEMCSNGLDDDGDGLADCDDSDCTADPACIVVPLPEICNNGLDDDGDLLTDCADSDCLGNPACVISVPEVCNNGVDDDGDGLVDCADSECNADPVCATVIDPEICYNGIDDDRDGRIDCADSDCFFQPGCGKAENCTNGIDDDRDGLKDCADSDCQGTPACSIEICDNGQDDDGDGKVDCQDPECGTFNLCAGNQAAEICNNGIDDDGDGREDCRDRDCRRAPECRRLDYDWKRIRKSNTAYSTSYDISRDDDSEDDDSEDEERSSSYRYSGDRYRSWYRDRD
ncbi:hypothetical protein DESUT3_21090 [Desulfuromonas versatilis]|uniref:Carboxypeptidase regulatory-like domain-containing protein n=1 Tax=Desulfuromonas versatilis TaxID=2802975 RepID=A0ABM8HWU1_9BACT|nr:carboxypeptidase-like regulatory domain-containing protein [Desulfuromonas versatilis]BCR05040.1 hypothetical protein DESUT3_21090 [Desulfuromonas versatilis]